MKAVPVKNLPKPVTKKAKPSNLETKKGATKNLGKITGKNKKVVVEDLSRKEELIKKDLIPVEKTQKSPPKPKKNDQKQPKEKTKPSSKVAVTIKKEPVKGNQSTVPKLVVKAKPAKAPEVKPPEPKTKFIPKYEPIVTRHAIVKLPEAIKRKSTSRATPPPAKVQKPEEEITEIMESELPEFQSEIQVCNIPKEFTYLATDSRPTYEDLQNTIKTMELRIQECENAIEIYQECIENLTSEHQQKTQIFLDTEANLKKEIAALKNENDAFLRCRTNNVKKSSFEEMSILGI